MKLNEGRTAGLNLIRSYDAAGITVGNDRHALPVLVAGTAIETGFEADRFAALGAADIARVIAHRPALVLAGSAGGAWQAPAALRRAFESERVAFEAMDLGAACRTFNVLVQEDREVVALLFP